jgi:hypothetical protein
MDYKIIRATAEIGQIEVEYSQAGKVFGVYAIDVPVVDGAFITGDALDAEIRLRAPSWAVQRMEEVATASGFDQIAALIQAEQLAPTIDPDARANAEMWEQARFEERVASALVKFGVLDSNPTQIQTSAL